jgi:hypothetical protein
MDLLLLSRILTFSLASLACWISGTASEYVWAFSAWICEYGQQRWKRGREGGRVEERKKVRKGQRGKREGGKVRER